MANESEPTVTGQGDNSSFSIEDQLSAFRTKLDGPPKETRIILTAPGFLFRHGKDVTAEFSARGLNALRRNDLLSGDVMYRSSYPGWNSWWASFITSNNNLLRQHTETYQKGLEVRDQIKEGIKPLEILGMVRDIWGKGEIEQTEQGGILTYSYLKTDAEVVTVKHEGTGRRFSSSPDAGYDQTTYANVKSGKWLAYSLDVKEEVAVSFGNADFPPHRLFGRDAAAINEFFVDQADPNYSERHNMLNHNHFPKEIWTRPDNLGISVTVPYALQNTNSGTDGVGNYKPIGYFEPIVWFDQSTSQQEIMDYLERKLKAQKVVGQLPPQVETLELAKIEELRKRGLFLEGASRIGKIWGSGAWIPGGWLDHA